MPSTALLQTLALAALVAMAPAHAATYNAANDWVDGSLEGPWSYGWDNGTSGYRFEPFDRFTAEPTYITWQYSSYITLSAPSAWKNNSGATWVGVADGAMALHPGPDASDTTGDAAVLRFTAPGTGAYTIQAQFGDGDLGETLAWVVLNSNFGAPLASLGATSQYPGFSATRTLAAGDTLDFLVGNGGDFYYDTTAVAVTISSPVPEPAGVAMMLAGLGLLACRRRVSSRGMGGTPGLGPDRAEALREQVGPAQQRVWIDRPDGGAHDARCLP